MGGRSRHKSFPDEGNSKEKALRKLVKQQEAEIKRLKAELKTLNRVLEDNSQYIKQRLDKVKVENLIENITFLESKEFQAEQAAKKAEKIKAMDVCQKCGAQIKSSTLPFGVLRTCTENCGWREVLRNERKETEETE